MNSNIVSNDAIIPSRVKPMQLNYDRLPYLFKCQLCSCHWLINRQGFSESTGAPLLDILEAHNRNCDHGMSDNPNMRRLK